MHPLYNNDDLKSTVFTPKNFSEKISKHAAYDPCYIPKKVYGMRYQIYLPARAAYKAREQLVLSLSSDPRIGSGVIL
tara:strand:+ start:303 stop:533 length:231 start_codon:yes stop_codon:yes gene_type:complete